MLHDKIYKAKYKISYAVWLSYSLLTILQYRARISGETHVAPPDGFFFKRVGELSPRSSTQVWALFSETRALREADISWFRHVASAKRACSLGMRCVTLAARDSCAIFVSLAHGPVPPQRRGLWWTKWEKTASLRARNVLWY